MPFRDNMDEPRMSCRSEISQKKADKYIISLMRNKIMHKHNRTGLQRTNRSLLKGTGVEAGNR